ncbi:Alpha/beta-hydrolase [Paramicrosporidium saccamoebae]|uniref:Alpha/beta-hydrolase n=1 Tax=Paramicrosporidium saccamoebae TaxID=1246581 RepID=A0A2H9THK5_9FUNG|nr:Alpha/beta-hydrolase [Paramicrosporidium saccamoebae]
MIRFHGYHCEEHLVVTADGYILLLHRVLPKEGRARHATVESTKSVFPSPASSVTGQTFAPPVLLLHGAMLSSEIWVCQHATDKNLAFALLDGGYDVWLANRRGTKYSQKHVYYKSSETRFWDYSLDETIMHDVPALTEYIISVNGHRTISLVGFSQGTAESFGALALNRKLQKRVNCVVGLSATAKPPTPSNSFILSMVHWSPELVFLVFGRKSMLRSVLFWQRLLSPRALAWGMDQAMYMLFGWTNRNILLHDRPNLYRHIFALSSVKQIVHWFQIMRAGRFQMFDDSPSKSHIVPEYPLCNIQTPGIVFLGGEDCLIDEQFVVENLLTATVHKMPGYEHMDTIWAHDANILVFPHILEFLQQHAPHHSSKVGRAEPSQLAWPPLSINAS